MIAAIISHLAAQEPTLPPTIVRVDEVDQLTCSLLERSSAQIAAGQWDEAIEALNQAKENAGDKLFKIEGHRYVPVREVCWQRLAALPSEALAKYRQRIDPIARHWYSEGVASHNAELLEKVVDQAFISSYGDDALLALGEIALEQADYNRARWCWERISPQLRTERRPTALADTKKIHRRRKIQRAPTHKTHAAAETQCSIGNANFVDGLSRYRFGFGRCSRSSDFGFDSGRIAASGAN